MQSLCLQAGYIFQARLRLTLRVASIPKVVLLRVAPPEHPDPEPHKRSNQCRLGEPQIDRVEGKVSRLEAECEGHPDKVSEREHEAVPVRRDVHLVEDV